MTTDTREALAALPNVWRDLYRRAINEANGLTNYVEDRPGLRSAEKRIAKIEEEARAALATQPSAQPSAQGEAVACDKWEGAEEWMPLAWELCADECGEEACTELVWEGGPVPEPWGDRWLKYEDEAKRLIALVRKHVPAVSAPAAPAQAVPSALPVAKKLVNDFARACLYGSDDERITAGAALEKALVSQPAQPSAQGEAVAHPSHQTVRDWMPVNEALRLADVWSVGDLDNCGQWRAAIKVLADEVRAIALASAPAAPAQAVPVADEDVEYPRHLFSALIDGNSPYAFYLFQWVPYQTDARRWRLKMKHDVRTFDGREAHGIWPNGSHCGPFRDDEVEFIRISRKQWGEEWQDPRPERAHGIAPKAAQDAKG